MSAKPSFVDLIVDMHLPPVFRSRLEDTLRDLQAQPPHGHPHAWVNAGEGFT